MFLMCIFFLFPVRTCKDLAVQLSKWKRNWEIWRRCEAELYRNKSFCILPQDHIPQARSQWENCLMLRLFLQLLAQVFPSLSNLSRT
ncbi:hypothetical protein AMEX_G19261 [Astyanax mexicanus]|uniref:Secreted protein n=1 Tax=Astyanax mexicanus TaxID=7994 RepID=A0A8T2L3T6_ASTMX|nr:hypothetical protein AMEX_G19261 [Astyanax mexicanus]